MERLNCESCKFFEPVFSSSGECHRYAPSPTIKVGTHGWPAVEKDDWCGDGEGGQ